jgi:hypothetical protein
MSQQDELRPAWKVVRRGGRGTHWRYGTRRRWFGAVTRDGDRWRAFGYPPGPPGVAGELLGRHEHRRDAEQAVETYAASSA